MRILVAPLFLSSFLNSAFEAVPQSPLRTGLGFSHFAADSWEVDFLLHPASLATLRTAGVTLLFASSFRLSALDQQCAAAAFPAGLANLAFAFSSLGRELYRETTFSAAMGSTVSEGVEMGIVLNGHELSIKRYGTSRAVGVSASVTYHLSEKAKWSLLYRNINSPRLGRSRESLPQVVATAFDYSPTPSVMAGMELERDLKFQSRFKFGLLWRLTESLAIGTGFASHPGQITAVFSVKPRMGSSGQMGEIGYAIATHPELAVSQLFAVRFTLP